ncbi:hypothetical protein COU76_05710 [Candidatus Peregrinibacteria bacterium CG10_big_fil_rev_8_21_14_0_10_49_10]|nr:MAG: hypothetical protein COU76_05710 [Candidatus Peregrinibacteria bacterium CG10_big_fil_rev_8_21_14_0_10_49_10]
MPEIPKPNTESTPESAESLLPPDLVARMVQNAEESFAELNESQKKHAERTVNESRSHRTDSGGTKSIAGMVAHAEANFNTPKETGKRSSAQTARESAPISDNPNELVSIGQSEVGKESIADFSSIDFIEARSRLNKIKEASKEPLSDEQLATKTVTETRESMIDRTIKGLVPPVRGEEEEVETQERKEEETEAKTDTSATVAVEEKTATEAVVQNTNKAENVATQEEAEEKREREKARLEEAVEKAAEKVGVDPTDKLAIKEVAERYKYGTKDERRKIQTVFRESYSEEEAGIVLKNLESDAVESEGKVLEAAMVMEKVAKQDKKLFKKMLEAEDIGAFVREEAKKGNTIFRDYIKSQKESLELKTQFLKQAAEQQKETREQEKALRQETNRILSDLGVTGSLADLPPAWNGALRKIERQEGNKEAARAFFANAPRLVYGTLTGSVRGAEMKISVDGTGSIIGHHAGDRARARPYELRDFSAQEFDDKFTWSIVDQDGHSLPNRSPGVRNALALFVAGVDTGDNALMTEKQANWFHNCNQILFGGNTEDKTESQRFRELGIDPAKPDQRALFDLGLGLRYLLPSSSEEEYKKEGGYVLVYEDVLTFMRLRNERGLQLPALEKLKKMTQNRLDGKEEWWKERERDRDHTGGA